MNSTLIGGGRSTRTYCPTFQDSHALALTRQSTFRQCLKREYIWNMIEHTLTNDSHRGVAPASSATAQTSKLPRTTQSKTLRGRNNVSDDHFETENDVDDLNKLLSRICIHDADTEHIAHCQSREAAEHLSNERLSPAESLRIQHELMSTECEYETTSSPTPPSVDSTGEFPPLRNASNENALPSASQCHEKRLHSYAKALLRHTARPRNVEYVHDQQDAVAAAEQKQQRSQAAESTMTADTRGVKQRGHDNSKTGAASREHDRVQLASRSPVKALRHAASCDVLDVHVTTQRLRKSIPAAWLGAQTVYEKDAATKSTPVTSSHMTPYKPSMCNVLQAQASPVRPRSNYASPTKASKQRTVAAALPSVKTRDLQPLRAVRSLGTMRPYTVKQSETRSTTQAPVAERICAASSSLRILCKDSDSTLESFPRFNRARASVSPVDQSTMTNTSPTKIPAPRHGSGSTTRRLESSKRKVVDAAGESVADSVRKTSLETKRAAILGPITRRLSEVRLASLHFQSAASETRKTDMQKVFERTFSQNLYRAATPTANSPAESGSGKCPGADRALITPPPSTDCLRFDVSPMEDVEYDTKANYRAIVGQVVSKTLRGNAPSFAPSTRADMPMDAGGEVDKEISPPSMVGNHSSFDLATLAENYVPADQWYSLTTRERMAIREQRRARRSSSASGTASWTTSDSATSCVSMDPQGNILSPTPAWHWSMRRTTHSPAKLGRAPLPCGPLGHATGGDEQATSIAATENGWKIGSAQPGWWYGWKGGDGREIAFVGYGPDAEREAEPAVNICGYDYRQHVNGRQSEAIISWKQPPLCEQSTAHAARLSHTPCGDVEIAQAMEHIAAAPDLSGMCARCEPVH